MRVYRVCGVVEVVVLLLIILALQRGQGDLTAWSIPVLLVVDMEYTSAHTFMTSTHTIL